MGCVSVAGLSKEKLEAALTKAVGIEHIEAFVAACKCLTGKSIQDLAESASRSVLACFTRQIVTLCLAIAKRDMLNGVHVGSITDADVWNAFGVTSLKDRLEIALAQQDGVLSKEEKQELREELKEKEEARNERQQQVSVEIFIVKIVVFNRKWKFLERLSTEERKLHTQALNGLEMATKTVSTLVSKVSTFGNVAELFDFLKEKKTTATKAETVDATNFCLLLDVIFCLRAEWKKNPIWSISHQLFPVPCSAPVISLSNYALVNGQEALRVVSQSVCSLFI